jgi:3-oxo-5alpha-steroid 4-dehydrogenase
VKVLVTGATGWVGSHVVRALLDAGHEVRVLVRSREKLHRVLGGHGPDHVDLGRLEVVVGDMLDRYTVAEAVQGCHAAVHTAGVVGVWRAGDSSHDANVEGTRLVVGAAVEAGCDPVVYTSSVATLVPTTDPVLTPDTPLAEAPGPYGRSKVEAERFVRALQAEGAPVTTFVIGGVHGPAQPEPASAMEGIVAAASQLMVVPDGGTGVIDVRDLSLLVAAALEPGRGPRRYMAGGRFLTWAEWTDLLGEVIGRPVRRVRVPNTALRAAAGALDAAKRLVDLDYPLTHEAAVEMTGTPPSDDSATLADLGVRYRPVRETLEDSARWLIAAGRLEPRFAPALAARATSAPGEEHAADWDEETDVLVVGFGVAGASAAIEAAEGGARVLVLDRWASGGASARSGGIVYAGGGTPQQRAAGFDDDPESMLEYLHGECDGAVSPEALRAFCEQSTANLSWLESHGVQIAEGFEARKVVTPVDDTTGLYYSGNEKQRPTAKGAIPRGHRVGGVGMTGKDLLDRLVAAARARGVEVRERARPLRLVERDGRVVGVEALLLPETPRVRALHRALLGAATAAGYGLRGVPDALTRRIEAFESTHGRRVRIRARAGVVLATGGFSFNRRMMDQHAPAFSGALPLGTPGDDGSGIELATALGAATRDMGHCGASRFIAPPAAFGSGVLVDARGERICDESLYAATLSRHIAERGGRAWLVIDAAVAERARAELRQWPRLRDQSLRSLRTGRANAVVFPRVFTPVNLHLNGVTADGVAELADRIGVPAPALADTLGRYDADARAGVADRFGKAAELVAPLDRVPLRAVPVHLDSRLFPAPCITLGGLDVDNLTQEVRRAGGGVVPGLYAVGRCAAGVASRSYVSGLSIADCIFSGRNAGRSTAAALRAASA